MNRRPRHMLLCVAGAGLALIVLCSAFGAAGNTDMYNTEVVFSMPSGFYEDEFDLEMKANGGTIYYTLDCSEPDEHSIRYTGPIHITDASANENVYSIIEDVSPYVDPDPALKEKYARLSTYPFRIPSYPVDKATVIRAVSIDDAGTRSETTEAVYFVGYGKKSGYENANIISIVTSPDNLFSADKGIYVLGQKFINYVEKKKIDNNPNPKTWDANYHQHGAKWERGATVHLFNADREMLLSQRCGIRIQGGYNRALLPKGFNLYAREEYGSRSFDIGTLFGDYAQLVYLNLSNNGNDIDTLLRDYLVNTMASDLDILTREYVLCAVFLDGEYWGNCWLIPRYRHDYLSQKYDVNSDNIAVIKNNEIEEGKDEDLKDYEEMLRFITHNDMSQSENYSKACSLLDIQSCIDYYALELYIGNRDWPNRNYAMWHTRQRDSSTYSDCRWRWILFDVNLAMIQRFADSYEMQFLINNDTLFASLMENEAFANAVYARIVSMAERFNPDTVGAFIEAYKTDMTDAMTKQYMRFYEGTRDIEYFYMRCDSVKEFFVGRYDFIMQKYGDKGQ